MLRLENISKYYYNSGNVTVGLEKINLSFNKGEFVAITGESGSGKTTLLNVLSGQDSYENGEMYFNCEPTSGFDQADWETYRRENIGFIFQNYNLIDSYTVLQNVESALWIKGYTKEEAKTKALSYINEVGLSSRKNHLASKLSAGQKQRLSIARALAKECEIIIADEPTGNLDSENGTEIMKLLSDLSKDMLVIIVTHNIEQAEPFITRKIHIVEGKVLTDEVRTPRSINTKDIEGATIKENKKMPFYFAGINFIAQPKRTILFFIFTLFVAIASYIFIGTFFGNIDDTFTKQYDNTAFKNSDPTRVVVQNTGKVAFSEEDLDTFSSLDNVTRVDKYNYVNDINYFYQKNIDYSIFYHVQSDEMDIPNYETITFLTWNNFMKSSSALKQEDLSKGVLPTNYNEVVVTTTDESILNKEIPIYFNNEKKWGPDYYVKQTCKVVGIIKGKTEQIYFDPLVSTMFETTAKSHDQYFDITFSTGSKTYTKKINIPTFTINNLLKDYEIVLSEYFLKDYSLKPSNIIQTATKFYYKLDESSKYNVVDNLIISDKVNQSTNKVVEINEKTYNMFYNDLSPSQAGLYLKDYAYVDATIQKLRKLGYEAVSPYQIGSTSYDDAKVQERLITLGVSLGFTIILYILEIVILTSLLRFKKNDYIILKTIGMKQKTVSQINILEILFYALTSFVFSILIMGILAIFKIEFIVNIVKYYKFYYYIVFFIINTGSLLITGLIFNHYLKTKLKVTALKEDM